MCVYCKERDVYTWRELEVPRCAVLVATVRRESCDASSVSVGPPVNLIGGIVLG